MCLVVITAHAVPAPQGPFGRAVERGVARGVERAVEHEIGRERGYRGGGFRRNGNYGSFGIYDGGYGPGYNFYG